jgi:hypothetical protein
VGEPSPRDWQPLAEFPLLIFVGVTGVGKSTVLSRLAGDLGATVLPDRRDLTDRLIIATIQAEDGMAVGPVADRRLRFEYTRRYRERFLGGMAQALGSLVIDPRHGHGPLVFDGLRGANEVRHAASTLPRARFVMLDAPDRVRVERLLQRRDAFDRVAESAPVAAAAGSFAALGVPEAAELFTAPDEAAMLAWVASGEVDAAELAAKLRIVVEERRSYDPAATLAALDAHAAQRTLQIDTVTCAPDTAVDSVIRWLSHPSPTT